MTATTLQRIPIERTDREWSLTVEDDDSYGFHWAASRLGVLWAKGWVRTRSISSALIHARQAGAAAYSDSILNPTPAEIAANQESSK